MGSHDQEGEVWQSTTRQKAGVSKPRSPGLKVGRSGIIVGQVGTCLFLTTHRLSCMYQTLVNKTEVVLSLICSLSKVASGWSCKNCFYFCMQERLEERLLPSEVEVPEEVHVFITQTHECITFQGKGTLQMGFT